MTLAVGAVEGSPSVMDMPLAEFDPSPGALDLPLKGKTERCSRGSRPAAEHCPECGSPLCDDHAEPVL